MTLSIFGHIINYETPTSVLTCMACSYIFVKYFQQRRKSLGVTLIFILALSDFVFCLNQILSYYFGVFFTETTNLYIILYFGCMHFSIGWASTISFLVYKSLLGKNFETSSVVLKFLLLILTISAAFTFYWSYGAEINIFYPLVILPLGASLITTFIFYSKSIAILKRQSEYDLKSTSTYIRTLRMYSIIQLITYGPLMGFLIAPMIWDFTLYSFTYFKILEVVDWMASLSGLLMSLAFIFRGSSNYNTPHIDHSGLDLTTDMI